MTQATSSRVPPATPGKRAWAYGGMIFAATMLVVLGVYQLFLGIAAISRESFFVTTSDYYYAWDTSNWGWVHLGIGIVAILVGLFLYTGQMWARVLGIIMAGLSAIANFFFLPYFPLWSMLIIALDIFVIWSLATVGSREQVAAMKREYLGEGAMAAGGGGARDADMTRTGDRWPATNKPAEGTRTGEATGTAGMPAGGDTRQSAFTGNPPASGGQGS